MRTIKFRGKRLTDGLWVYGDLKCGSRKENFAIHTYDMNGWYNRGYMVDPTTVGQFTGLHDKNGKEIYEGDILKMGNCDFRGVVQWHKNGYFYINEYYPKVIDDDYSPLGNMLCYDMDVIGNVFDNPELIEKGGKA